MAEAKKPAPKKAPAAEKKPLVDDTTAAGAETNAPLEEEIKPPVDAAKTVPGIRVTSRVAGFRRAGRAWPVEAVDLTLDEITDEQLVMILDEPKLTVVNIDLAAE